MPCIVSAARLSAPMLNITRSFALAGALALAACASTPPSLDTLAEQAVRLELEFNTHDEGFVDAYYGPPEWREAAEAEPRSLAQLERDADALAAALARVPAEGDDARRRDYMHARVVAARARMDMIEGVRLPFLEEAERVFGVRPAIRPLESFDPVLARLEEIVPGQGPLPDRIEAFRANYLIPTDRYEAVIRAAIAECRARTLAHIALPEGESFDLEFVSDKPWSGYNWYQGGFHSLIQINTDQRISIDRPIELGCHEGYPGHHTHNVLLETDLARGRGWIEFTLFPLYAPVAIVAEGEGNFGVELAFPGDEKLRFEQRVLYPLAGLDPATAPAFAAFDEAMAELASANVTIAQMYLDGEIDRERAIALTQRYLVRSRARAEQSIDFAETYRTYIINYTAGLDLVRAHVLAAGPDVASRWAAMRRVLAEPTLPRDLLP